MTTGDRPQPQRGQSDFVAKLVTDPANPPETDVFTGYPGQSSQDKHARFYLDIALSQHIDVPEEDILLQMPVPDDTSGLGSVMVWVKKDAKLQHGGPATRSKASFLEGAVADTYAPQIDAQAMGLGAQLGQQLAPTVLCPSRTVQCRSIFLNTCRTFLPENCHSVPLYRCPSILDYTCITQNNSPICNHHSIFNNCVTQNLYQCRTIASPECTPCVNASVTFPTDTINPVSLACGGGLGQQVMAQQMYAPAERAQAVQGMEGAAFMGGVAPIPHTILVNQCQPSRPYGVCPSQYFVCPPTSNFAGCPPKTILNCPSHVYWCPPRTLICTQPNICYVQVPPHLTVPVGSLACGQGGIPGINPAVNPAFQPEAMYAQPAYDAANMQERAAAQGMAAPGQGTGGASIYVGSCPTEPQQCPSLLADACGTQTALPSQVYPVCPSHYFICPPTSHFAGCPPVTRPTICPVISRCGPCPTQVHWHCPSRQTPLCTISFPQCGCHGQTLVTAPF